MATPIHTAEQGDYRMAQQCGADDITAEDVAANYRLSGGARPIERIGGGWAEFGIEAGSVLESGEDVEQMRRLLAGRAPDDRTQLVKPKVAVAPEALLDAAPFVAALEAAAAERGQGLAELVATDPWSVKRLGRLERGLKRDGEHHRAPVLDLARVATAAGIDPRHVYDLAEWHTAWKHRDDRVSVGVRGYDVTFDRPKGISVLQGLAPQAMAERMEQIHLEAVRESMAALESWVGYTMAGHHGDGQRAQRVDTSGLVGTMTVHRTARPVDDHTPGDPHLHTHVLVANLARGSDGKWRTIAAGGRDLMRHVPAVGELYRALERNKLTREFGVRFRQDARTGRWDVVGVPDDLKRTFSRRQAQVLAKAGDGATPEQGRAAARATARAKVASTPHSERASWHERARQAEHHPRQVVAAALEGREPGEPTTQRGGPEGPSPIDPDTVAAAVWDPQTGVTANTKTATRAKVMAHVAGVCGTGLPNAADLEELTDHVLDHELAQALPKSTSHFTHADRYTSVDLVAAERTITDAATRRLGEGAGVVDTERAKKALGFWQQKKGFRPSPEQARTIVRLIRAGHGIDMVQGVAGAGKTTIMSAARTAWEADGLRVEGAAVAAVAASGLRAEAGITTRTVAAWRKRISEGPGLTGVNVLVLDESAMVADRDLAALVAEAAKTNTKIVGIGDSQQLRAVGAGGAFARVHELVGGETLTENRRQRHEVDRTALEVWRQGGRHTALALWGEHGLIRAPADLETAYGQMAAAWWNDRQAFLDDPHEATEKLLLLAATNHDVSELNERARAIARTEGLLTSPDTHFHVRGGERLALAAGDQVRVRENDYRSRRDPDQADVLNGFRGVVLEVDARRGAHIEWSHAGQTERAWIDPAQIGRGGLVHGYAITIAASQGLTSERSHVLGHGADAHSLYPAMSRATERVELYLPAAEIEREETRLRLGEPRSDRERLDRVISAYAASLTDEPEGMVTDELPGGRATQRGRQEQAAERAPEPDRDQEAAPDHDRAQADHEDGQQRQDAAPTPWQPLSMAEARAGYGPAAREAAPQVRAIHQRQIELRDELAERREAEREAAGRLARGRLRLLLEGTTPSQVRAEHQKAGENVRGIFEEQAELGQREQQIRSQAIARDMEQARADAERQRREQEIQGLERGALSRGLTLNELRTMEREEFDRLRTRTALESSRIGSTLHRDPPSKIDLQEQEKRERARQVPVPVAKVDHNREHLERAQREAQRTTMERNAPGLGL